MKLNIVFIVVYGTVGAGTLERKKKKEKRVEGEHPRPTLTQSTTSYDNPYI